MTLSLRLTVRKFLAIALAGSAVGVALAQQPASTPPSNKTSSAPAPEANPPKEPSQSGDPLGTMTAEAKIAYSKVRDYVCVYTRQERINGILGAEQVAELKARTRPFSIAIRFARPEAVAGQEAKFVSSAASGKMKFRYAPSRGKSGVFQLAPNDPKVMAETRHPITETGVGAVIERLNAIISREQTAGNALEVYSSEFQFAGRNATRYEVFARRAHTHRYAYRTLVYVDHETKLPLRFEAYDEAKPGTTVGDLLESYSYTDIRLNVGVGDSSFE